MNELKWFVAECEDNILIYSIRKTLFRGGPFDTWGGGYGFSF